MREKPKILTCEEVARSRLFRVEQLQLRFSNGAERTYERLAGKSNGHGAVMIVAMPDDEHVLLVEEYCAGTESYELSLPKGLIDPGEDALQAANRELQEEAGFAAKKLEWITQLSVSPGYMRQIIQVVLARDLYPSRLQGDEPEPMGVTKVKINNLMSLIEHPQFSEGRALAAMYVVRDLLRTRGEID